MKKWLFFLVIGVAIGSGVYQIIPQDTPTFTSAGTTLHKAFEASTADFTEVRFQGWSQINSRFSSIEELKTWSKEIEDIVGLTGGNTEEVSDQVFSSVETTGTIASGNKVKVLLQSLWDGRDGSETYLIINFSVYDHPEDIQQWRERLVKAFELFGQKPDIDTLFVGYFNGNLEKYQKENIIKGIFQSTKGKIIEGIDEFNYISKTGFVPGLPDSLPVGSKKANIQVAITFNELENRTYLYIGSPLITGEY